MESRSSKLIQELLKLIAPRAVYCILLYAVEVLIVRRASENSLKRSSGKETNYYGFGFIEVIDDAGEK